MRVEDVDNFFIRIACEMDPPGELDRKVQLHYLAVLAAIANGRADPDPVTLARAVLRGVAGECHTPEVRFVQSSDSAVSGDNIS